MATCPCCHQTVAFDRLLVDLTSNLVSRGDRTVRVNRRTAEFIHLLSQAAPDEVRTPVLIARLYGVNEPAQPEKGLHAYALFARRALKRLNAGVIAVYGVGYHLVLHDMPARACRPTRVPDATADAIRNDGRSLRTLAKVHGISHQTVWRIKHDAFYGFRQ